MTGEKGNPSISPSRRILDKIRNGLVLQVLRNQLSKIGIEITPFYLTLVGTSAGKAPEIRGGEERFSCGFLEEKDLIRMNNDPRGYSVNKLLGYLKKGRKCYGIKKGSEVTAFVWIDLKECNFDPLRFPLRNHEAYTFSAYTMEAYRGRGIAPYMAYHCYRELQAMGRTRIYSVSEYFNRSAIRYKMKLGTRKLRLYLHVRLFKKYQRRILVKAYEPSFRLPGDATMSA